MRFPSARPLLLVASLAAWQCGPAATLGPYHLTLPSSVAHGTLTASPTEPSGGYAAGTQVTLTAVPDTDYALASWSGTNDDNSTANTNTVTMSANKTVDVVFETASPAGRYRLTLQTSGNVTLAASSSTPTQTGPDYTPNTVVQLQATLGAAGHKVSWTGTDNDSSTATTNQVTLGSAPVTVTATSACDTQCTLTVLVDFPDFGHVTVTDASQGLSQSTSGGSTAIQSLPGHVLTLTAHDSPSWPFPGWGAPLTSSSACVGTLTLNADQTVSASFPDVPAHAQNCP